MRHWKRDTAHPGHRCGHAWCSDCRTRRGNNRGNRNERHRIRTVLGRLTGKGAGSPEGGDATP